MSEEQVVNDPATGNVEQEARSLGWVPREDFRGNPERWVDAQEFVERGHTVMPLLRANNKKLEERLARSEAETHRLQELFNAAQDSITALQEFHTEQTRAAVQKARHDLLEQLKAAREDNDVDREVAITEQMNNLRDAEREANQANNKKPTDSVVTTPNGGKVDPDFLAWYEDNKSWYGPDQRKTMKALGIAQQLRADPSYDTLGGRAFYDKVVEIMNGPAPAPASKVAEGYAGGFNNSGGSSRRSYADLPPDAKAACDRQGKRLVGEGRAFKDTNAWRAYYTSKYYEVEE